MPVPGSPFASGTIVVEVFVRDMSGQALVYARVPRINNWPDLEAQPGV
jgi:hypothetical protein